LSTVIAPSAPRQTRSSALDVAGTSKQTSATSVAPAAHAIAHAVDACLLTVVSISDLLELAGGLPGQVRSRR
jgi:hypothetical protein